jgi:prolipoprotein diacylglyceryl transferase
MLAYLPSPPSNGISVGPLRLHMYGFLIVAGVFAAVWLADRRWSARGGEPGTFSAIALWAVPAGLVGARLYHVVTDYELYTHHPIGALEIWQGGLGIWGGIAGGTLAAWVYVRRHHLDFPAIMDAVAPALPLAQAIGRWGNYFNQELFGRPTKLPWGLKIDPSIVANLFPGKAVPPAYLHAAAFQPTFLYESLWDLAVVGLVLWTEKHVRLHKGYLFGVYVALYTFGRFFTEYLRIDFAHKILGLRINDWVSVIVFVGAVAIVLTKGRDRRKPPVSTDEADAEEDEEAELASVAAGAGQSSGPAAVGGDTLTEGSMGLMTDHGPETAGPEVEAFSAIAAAEAEAPAGAPSDEAAVTASPAPAATEAAPEGQAPSAAAEAAPEGQAPSAAAEAAPEAELDVPVASVAEAESAVPAPHQAEPEAQAEVAREPHLLAGVAEPAVAAESNPEAPIAAPDVEATPDLEHEPTPEPAVAETANPTTDHGAAPSSPPEPRDKEPPGD